MEINAYSTLTEYSEPRVASSPVQSQGLPHINPTSSSSDYPAGFENSDNVESPSATSEGQNSSEATENQKQSSTLDYEALNTFSAHIHELYEYIFSRFNVSAGSGQFPQEALDLLEHLRSTQWHYSFKANASDPSTYRQLLQWSAQNNAVLLMEDGMFIDPAGQPLLPTPSVTTLGHPPIIDSAQERFTTIQQQIRDNIGVDIPDTFTPVRAPEELAIKPAEDIQLRAIALCMVADYADSVLRGDPIDPALMEETSPEGFAARTKEEKKLFETADPGLAEKLSWRSEAVGALTWALGRYELPSAFTGEPTDGAAAFPTALDMDETPTVRDIDELLDAQQTYRSLMAAARRGMVRGTNFDPNSGIERLWALNWLLDGHTLEWDTTDVSV
ncbi:DUF4272 domain-containing protein [Corynebacterium kroppenstedtii]|uniref:DUF4272 domain-containing protein n=1 Tax=uncultured Corynebacterium sp. TaxID=159447 RepID=UPI0025D6D919|nr:DUF4272 domain-containing protein [uncultured Corynebacterium sp.]